MLTGNKKNITSNSCSTLCISFNPNIVTAKPKNTHQPKNSLGDSTNCEASTFQTLQPPLSPGLKGDAAPGESNAFGRTKVSSTGKKARIIKKISIQPTPKTTERSHVYPSGFSEFIMKTNSSIKFSECKELTPNQKSIQKILNERSLNKLKTPDNSIFNLKNCISKTNKTDNSSPRIEFRTFTKNFSPFDKPPKLNISSGPCPTFVSKFQALSENTHHSPSKNMLLKLKFRDASVQNHFQKFHINQEIKTKNIQLSKESTPQTRPNGENINEPTQCDKDNAAQDNKCDNGFEIIEYRRRLSSSRSRKHAQSFKIKKSTQGLESEKKKSIFQQIRQEIGNDCLQLVQNKLSQEKITLSSLKVESNTKAPEKMYLAEQIIDNYLTYLHNPTEFKSPETGMLNLIYDDDMQLKQIDPFTQNALENYSKKFISFSPEYLSEINEGFSVLKQKYNAWTNTPKIDDFHDKNFLKPASNRLSQVDVDKIKEQFEKKKYNLYDFEINVIDNIVKDLNFFVKFTMAIRFLLINLTKYEHFPAGSLIFSAGDFGENMYIILRGSVNIIVKKKNPVSRKEEDTIIACLYDGQIFGEYSMLGTFSKKKPTDKEFIEFNPITSIKEIYEGKKIAAGEENIVEKKTENQNGKNSTFIERTKRSATVVALESTDVLSLPRSSFQNILLNLIQTDLDDKIRVLMVLPFFEHLEPFSLIPMASCLILETFKIGQYLIKSGEYPEKLIIIASGSCNILAEKTVHRTVKPSEHVKGLVSKLKNFQFTKEEIVKEENQTTEQIQSKHSKKRDTFQVGEVKIRSFDFDLKQSQNKKDVAYNKQIVITKISRGEYVGARSLLSKNLGKDGSIIENMESEIRPARLSAIAESSVVTAYVFSQKNLHLIPDNMMKVLMDGISQYGDFDDFADENIINDKLAWEDYKVSTYNITMNDNFNKRSNTDMKFKNY